MTRLFVRDVRDGWLRWRNGVPAFGLPLLFTRTGTVPHRRALFLPALLTLAAMGGALDRRASLRTGKMRDVRVRRDGMHLDGQLALARAEIAQGYVPPADAGRGARTEPTVRRLDAHGRHRLEVERQDEAEGRALLAGLDLDVRKAAATFEGSTFPSHLHAPFPRLILLALGATAAIALGQLGAAQILALLAWAALSAVVGAAILGRRTRCRFVVGLDRLAVEGPRPRLVAIGEVALRRVRALPRYRAEARRDEDLWAVVEDASAPEDARAGATPALLPELDRQGVERVRIAARATASPRLRVARQEALDDEVLAASASTGTACR